LQLFPYINTPATESNLFPFICPDSQSTESKIITEYYYFDSSDRNIKAISKNDMLISNRLSKKTGLLPSYREGAEKIVTVSVK
jgi:hypothetical protein